MSTTAARRILSIDGPSNSCEVQPPEGGISSIVSLSDLKRPEILRAAKVAFPTVGGREWQKVGNALILQALRSGDSSEALGTQEERVNRYPANCTDCGKRLSEGEGRIRKEGKKWASYCPEHLPKSSEPTIEWTDDKEEPKKAPKLAPAPSGDGVTDAITAIVSAVVDGKLATHETGTDVETVRAIVVEMLESEPARRVEIVTPDATRELPELHHHLLPEVTLILGSGVENVFLVGPAGSGKSTIGEQAAEALGIEARSISFGPTTPTSKLFGYNDASGNYVGTPFRDAYENGYLFIGDELDNGHPGLVAELNQALANPFAAFADGLVRKHSGFRFVATGNTFGRGPDRLFVGRNILDAATLDRFVTIECPVDERLERLAALAYATDESEPQVEAWVKTVQAARANIDAHKLPLVCSPRSSINGAKLLTAGLTQDRVMEITLAKGWSDEHRAKAGVQ